MIVLDGAKIEFRKYITKNFRDFRTSSPPFYDSSPPFSRITDKKTTVEL